MRNIITMLILLLTASRVFAQAPKKMSYQAVIRDASNSLVTSQLIGMKISILQDYFAGIPVYAETQNPTSDANGLVSLEIGTGAILLGNFSTIDWANHNYFIKFETDPTGGNSYTITSSNQLLSVPYALYASTSDYASTAGTKTYTLGLWPELGGYVFSITSDGKHGLVAETQDIGPAVWYDAQNLISNPDNHSTNGKKFKDWRLPTLYELDIMYPQRSAIPYLTYQYWSSTEIYNNSTLNAESNAYYKDFFSGNNGYFFKGVLMNTKILSVRSF